MDYLTIPGALLSFVMVRHPLDRLVSAYYDKIVGNPTITMFKKMTMKPGTKREELIYTTQPIGDSSYQKKIVDQIKEKCKLTLTKKETTFVIHNLIFQILSVSLKRLALKSSSGLSLTRVKESLIGTR